MPLAVFTLRESVVHEYQEYVRSFVRVLDSRIGDHAVGPTLGDEPVFAFFGESNFWTRSRRDKAWEAILQRPGEADVRIR